jgi:hypothetical protein
MGLDVHTVEMIDDSQFSRTDRVLLAFLPQVAFASGATTLAITNLSLPATYGVFVSSSTTDAISVGSRTNTGFTLTFAAAQSAAGTVDILVVA